jgi:hypothetical protein
MVVLSPSDVLEKGLTLLGIEQNIDKQKRLQFHKHYGSSPLDLAEMWYDLTVTDIPAARMDEEEKSEKVVPVLHIDLHHLFHYTPVIIDPAGLSLETSFFETNCFPFRHDWLFLD